VDNASTLQLFCGGVHSAVFHADAVGEELLAVESVAMYPVPTFLPGGEHAIDIPL
jgi:hypothetical protein